MSFFFPNKNVYDLNVQLTNCLAKEYLSKLISLNFSKSNISFLFNVIITHLKMIKMFIIYLFLRKLVNVFARYCINYI